MSLKSQNKDSTLYLKRILRWVCWLPLFAIGWLACKAWPIADWLEYDDRNDKPEEVA